MKIFSIIFLLFYFESFCQNDSIDSYKYPITIGSQEWKSNSSSENKKICQIPDNILKKISTKGLIITCLNYPFWGDIMAKGSFQTGFNILTKNFNGLYELLLRSDVGTELLEIYKTLNPELLENNRFCEKGNYIIKFFHIEFLLAQNQVISKMNIEEKNELIKECLKKYYSKKQIPNVYGDFSINSVIFPLLKSLVYVDDQFAKKKSINDKVSKSLASGEINKDLINEILLSSKNYISKFYNEK